MVGLRCDAGADVDHVSALTPLRDAVRIVLEQHYRQTTRYKHSRAALDELCALFPATHLETLTAAMLRTWVQRMRLKGSKTTTINAKLSTVGVMFRHFELEGRKVPYVRQQVEPKWWLTPEIQTKALTWCDEHDAADLADYIRWTVLTGLRVEETLRVKRMHFTGLATDQPSLTVPGTKTRAAQACIPLLREAADLALKRIGADGSPTDDLFRIRQTELRPDSRRWRSGDNGAYEVAFFRMRYVMLQQAWKACRSAIGLERTPGATLKAFRRSFARLATERGLPTDMLRQYLRHEHITTTAGYLKLVGGYGTEQMREWFR